MLLSCYITRPARSNVKFCFRKMSENINKIVEIKGAGGPAVSVEWLMVAVHLCYQAKYVDEDQTADQWLKKEYEEMYLL